MGNRVKQAWFNAQRFNKATLSPVAAGLVWFVDRFGHLELSKDDYAIVTALVVGVVVLFVPNREKADVQ